MANPTSMILSACHLLRHLGLDSEADKISAAVFNVYTNGKVRTPDIGGTSTTTEFCNAVIKEMEKTFA